MSPPFRGQYLCNTRGGPALGQVLRWGGYSAYEELMVKYGRQASDPVTPASPPCAASPGDFNINAPAMTAATTPKGQGWERHPSAACVYCAQPRLSLTLSVVAVRKWRSEGFLEPAQVNSQAGAW